MITKDQLEQLCLQQFQDTGSNDAYSLDMIPPDNFPERSGVWDAYGQLQSQEARA